MVALIHLNVKIVVIVVELVFVRGQRANLPLPCRKTVLVLEFGQIRLYNRV